MGYTHYWNKTKDTNTKITTSEWVRFSDDVYKLLMSHQTFERNVIWKISNDSISFNGTGDEEYEDFVIGLEQLNTKSFNFCKTAHRIYDDIVQATLLLVKIHFGDKVRISVDNRPEDGYVDGLEILKQLGFLHLKHQYSVEEVSKETDEFNSNDLFGERIQVRSGWSE